MGAVARLQAAVASGTAESLLRGACAAASAASALLLGLSAQTKTVLFVRKKAVPKDVEALWYVRARARPSSVTDVLPSFATILIEYLLCGQGADRGGRRGRGVPRGEAPQAALLRRPLRRRRGRRQPELHQGGRVGMFPPRQGEH